MGGDSLNEKIERRYGECDVTITFKENAEDIKEKVLWLMLENYKSRIEQKALEAVSAEDTKEQNDG